MKAVIYKMTKSQLWLLVQSIVLLQKKKKFLIVLLKLKKSMALFQNIKRTQKTDVRRMERIRFPKFCIENCPHAHLLVWENKRGRDERVLIFNEIEGYLIVLTKRTGYYLFWTAYHLQHNHQKRKHIKEYEAYIKAKTA